MEGQLAELKQEILKHKDHPALLLWGIGNEVDLQYTNTRVWDSVEALASSFTRWIPIIPPPRCLPASIRPKSTWSNPLPQCRCAWGQRIREHRKVALEHSAIWMGQTLPRHGVGVNGPFEAPKTAWGAKKEPPGGVKAATRLRRFEEIIAADSARCLGSYCFLWGQNKSPQQPGMGSF